MKFGTQKKLAAKILGVGTGKVWFDPLRLSDIQQAITREDIRDLIKDRAIRINPSVKRTKNVKSVKRLSSRRMRPSGGKRPYINKIRKMRRHLKQVYAKGEISKDSQSNLRKLAKAGQFRNLKHLKESMKVMNLK